MCDGGDGGGGGGDTGVGDPSGHGGEVGNQSGGSGVLRSMPPLAKTRFR